MSGWMWLGVVSVSVVNVSLVRAIVSVGVWLVEIKVLDRCILSESANSRLERQRL